MASTSETGLQLFARLFSRPSLVGLDDCLFPDGPNPREVIELTGDQSCGKTLLCIQFIAKSIMPKEWKGVKTSGLNSEVVLLNTDHHFHMYKLISVMESWLRGKCSSFTSSDIEKIIKESLGKLIIYNIADSVQFQVTMFALQNVVSNKPEIGLILLDSISAYYWQDCMTSGNKRMDTYTKNILKSLQKSLLDFKGVIVYTRPSYFQSKPIKTETSCVGVYLSEPAVGRVNRRVTLKHCGRDDASTNIFSAIVESASGQFEKKFIIDSVGIQWFQ